MSNWEEAATVVAQVQTQLTTLATVSTQSGRVFTVRGWPFAIVRNGTDRWDILGPNGLSEAIAPADLADEIRGQVMQCEEDNASWDFDPQEVEI